MPFQGTEIQIQIGTLSNLGFKASKQWDFYVCALAGSPGEAQL
jgi:hypothetical protein